MKIKTKEIIIVAMFSALTAIGAFIKIPVGPAPINLQFLFTALSGTLLGAKLGALSQLVYILIGLIGIPVFTSGGGPSYIFNPTFGYLIGFIISSFMIGNIVEKYEKPSFRIIFGAALLGIMIVYIIGVPYLYFIMKNFLHKGITFDKAMKIGCIIFIPGDLAKCVITAFLGSKIIPVIKKVIKQ